MLVLLTKGDNNDHDLSGRALINSKGCGYLTHHTIASRRKLKSRLIDASSVSKLIRITGRQVRGADSVYTVYNQAILVYIIIYFIYIYIYIYIY